MTASSCCVCHTAPATTVTVFVVDRNGARVEHRTCDRHTEGLRADMVAAGWRVEEPDAAEDDGPECETCGKTTCPDATLPGFSEPVNCAYAPIYHALKDSKDCDYGCARDYTTQAVRLWVVEAVEQIVHTAQAQAWDEGFMNAAGQDHPAYPRTRRIDNPYQVRTSPEVDA